MTLFEEFIRVPAEVVTGNPGATRIAPADGSGGGAVVVPEGLFALSPEAWLTGTSVPSGRPGRGEIPLQFRWPGGPSDLPALFEEQDVPLLVEEDGEARLGADLLGLAFFLLTRYEEVAAPVADRHGRHPASATVQGRNG
ncbi:MAG TPA: hypothetical protein VFI13_00055, partial [Gemmatimonadales bacterium]|nr:hypothetical protein [Gemmatimonadales bacterium]